MSDLAITPRLIGLPRIAPAKKGPPLVTISYQRPKSEVDEIRSNKGDITMSNKEVGLRTFAYYRRAELGK